MNTEVEVKFLNVNHDTIRESLQSMGASLVTPMRLLQRVTIETPELIKKNAYVRIRDQGDKVTMTYKQFDSLSVDGAKEIETEVGDFKAATALLAAAGLPYQSLQESKRETWTYEDVEIVLDEWPWLSPYIEIEGKSEDALKMVAQKMNLDWKDAAFGDVMVAYRADYPHLGLKDTIGRIPEVKFGDPLPSLLKP